MENTNDYKNDTGWGYYNTVIQGFTTPAPTSGSSVVGSQPMIVGYVGDQDVERIYNGNAIIWEPVYSAIPMTFKILTGGTINLRHNRTLTGDVGNLTLQYRINNGTWTSITSTTAGTSFSVSAGDKVQFKGDNAQYGTLPLSYTTFCGSTASFEAYGNVMSLVDSVNFKTATTITEQYAFNRLFAGSKVTNGEHLILPATTIPMHVYTSMFQDCTLMAKAPELPAPTLTNSCYNEMFNGCTNLSYIKCLATDTSAYNCTYNWVSGVASSGTFVKDANTTWSTGNSGTPSNWTVIDA